MERHLEHLILLKLKKVKCSKCSEETDPRFANPKCHEIESVQHNDHDGNAKDNHLLSLIQGYPSASRPYKK